ncbi:MAG: 2-amino-4-hydroxy-6-hydroxymethyldihydropteridine diphosphokinase [Ruminococcaceae bacterium]|nr:2-amino-4-hydroxy-6-hydroxymethyldihydropteridine diphosphokinase [Oscillospiraceae bacterium]
MKAVLSIGTNLGDRLRNIDDAVNSLERVPKLRVLEVSPIYETEPWGYAEQDNFFNCAVTVETELSPSALLGACLGIEAALGRVRKIKFGPRIIDIDILLYEGFASDTEELTVPHKFIFERDFVLVPLHDLFPSGTALGFDFSEAYKKTDLTKLKMIKS